MICLQNANAYFKGRTVGAYWEEYSGNQKEAAINQARRDLARALHRPMKDDGDDYKEGDTKCDEFAVYEQALYSLLKDAQPMGGGSAVPSLEPDEAQTPRKTLAVGNDKWSIEALAWLCDKLSIVTRLG